MLDGNLLIMDNTGSHAGVINGFACLFSFSVRRAFPDPFQRQTV